MEYTHIVHGIPPVYDKNSRVLILGTMPSPKSRENGFFYGNKQNRFWRALAAVRQCAVPQTNAQKTAFLLENRIALWDTVAECDIIGAADGSIKNVVPTDLSAILNTANIKKVFTTGKTAYRYYCKYQLESTGIEAVCLPSPSPANAAVRLERLIEEYSVINRYI